MDVVERSLPSSRFVGVLGQLALVGHTYQLEKILIDVLVLIEDVMDLILISLLFFKVRRVYRDRVPPIRALFHRIVGDLGRELGEVRDGFLSRVLGAVLERLARAGVLLCLPILLWELAASGQRGVLLAVEFSGLLDRLLDQTSQIDHPLCDHLFREGLILYQDRILQKHLHCLSLQIDDVFDHVAEALDVVVDYFHVLLVLLQI